MGRLYEQYLKLKNENPKRLYLFKSGLFYIALEDDALMLSNKFKLKLTNLGNTTLKCGFPESRLNYYTEHFKLQNIDYILVKFESNNKKNVGKILNTNLPLNIDKEISEILSKLAKLDINNITLKESFDELYSFHIKAKKIIGEN